MTGRWGREGPAAHLEECRHDEQQAQPGAEGSARQKTAKSCRFRRYGVRFGRISGGRARRFRRRSGSPRRLLRRDALRQRNGVRRHPASRSVAQKPDGRAAGQAHGDEGVGRRGRSAGPSRPRLCHSAGDLSRDQKGQPMPFAAEEPPWRPNAGGFLLSIPCRGSAAAGDLRRPFRRRHRRDAGVAGRQGTWRPGGRAGPQGGGLRQHAAQRL